MKGGRREGSGRRPERRKLETCCWLSIASLRRAGALGVDGEGEIAWSNGAQVSYRHSQGQLLIPSPGGGLQAFKLARTPCHFGRERVWIECSCGSRVSKLFLACGSFACRRCHGLAYASTSLDYIDRLWWKQEKLERRLGPNLGRPRGMHQATYERLKAEILDLMMRRFDLIDRFADRYGRRCS